MREKFKKGKIVTILAILVMALIPLSDVGADSAANYYCQQAGFVVKVDSAFNDYGCCPNGYSFSSNVKRCYTEASNGKCPYGTKLDNKGRCFRESKTAIKRSEACFACGNTQGQTYRWGTYYDDRSCGKTNYTKLECGTAGNSSQCWHCRTTGSNYDTYIWGKWREGCISSSLDVTKCGKDGSYKLCTSDYLQSGCSGALVTKLQKDLNSVTSCSLDVDGSYGSKTTACVKSFQSANGLTSDGIAGQKTLNALSNKVKELSENKVKEEVESALPWYKITFDTNGGYFANGETTRVVYMLSTMSFTMPVMPGKYDEESDKYYKFLGWYDASGNLAKFGNVDMSVYGTDTTKVNEFTLTAKWEVSDTENYCEKGDVFDIESNSCITAQEFNPGDYSVTNAFPTIAGADKIKTMQTVWKYNSTCVNSIRKNSAELVSADGANNNVPCADGYVKEFWRADEKCFASQSCNSDAGECERTFRGMCHAGYTSLSIPYADDEEDNIIPDDDKNSSDDKTIEDIIDNPKTGGILMFIAWVVGLSALGYSVYYFKKNKKIKENTID